MVMFQEVANLLLGWVDCPTHQHRYPELLCVILIPWERLTQYHPSLLQNADIDLILMVEN